MDGLDDTDTSQDEVDSSPGGHSKFKKLHSNANGAARLAPTEEPSSYVTTDDESVGPGGAQTGQGQLKGRRPRAKLQVQVQGSSPSGTSAVSHTGAQQDESSGYQPSTHQTHSTAPDKADKPVQDRGGAAMVSAAPGASGTGASTGASVAGGAAGAGGEGESGAAVSTKVKRRVRTQVAKPKGDAAEGVGGAPSAAPGPAAAVQAGPWDTELDQW